MVHGIYVKSRPKSKWRLIYVAVSAKDAEADRDEALRQAIKDGHEAPEVAIQIFDSALFIPELLTDIKRQEPLYN